MSMRALTEKEQKVFNRFSNHKLEKIEAKSALFSGAKSNFVINEPAIYKVGNSNSILVFGEPREAMSLDGLKQWIAKLQDSMPSESPANGETEKATAVNGEGPGSVSEGEGEAVESDPRLKESDVRLIIEQVNLPREEVIAALRRADYDVVNALVDLSKK